MSSSPMDSARHLEVVGAGPAGLSAAITARAAGTPVTVYEKRPQVGARFHGDFQGLENWTTEEDVLLELERMGLALGPAVTPVREIVCFDARGKARSLRSSRGPVFYLVSRGPADGTLDTCLLRQAIKAGAALRYATRQNHLEAGGIVAEGPHAADIIAAGYTFQTGMVDGYFGALSDDLAPEGYAYLLVHRGRGTVATCLSREFHDERRFVERTVEFFERHAGLRWQEPRPFGGSGNVSLEATLHRGSVYYAGESAGLQDALFGFGLRHAMLSGCFAARAWLCGSPEMYERWWRSRARNLVRAGFANRHLYWALGARGRQFLLRHWVAGSDPRRLLKRIYQPNAIKTLLGSIAPRRRLGQAEARPGCHCTWCRCQSEICS